jgi:hypothetical protein
LQRQFQGLPGKDAGTCWASKSPERLPGATQTPHLPLPAKRHGLRSLKTTPQHLAVTMTTIETVRELASTLPRSYEVLVRDRVKFRVGKIVYLAFSPDERMMGFAFPKEERKVLIDSEPNKFLMPSLSDQRFNWLELRLDAVDDEEIGELVWNAWRMVVPKRLAAANPYSPRRI